MDFDGWGAQSRRQIEVRAFAPLLLSAASQWDNQ